eukprot:10071-Chlamydomonas_euryale.AAC.4
MKTDPAAATTGMLALREVGCGKVGRRRREEEGGEEEGMRQGGEEEEGGRRRRRKGADGCEEKVAKGREVLREKVWGGSCKGRVEFPDAVSTG